MFIWWHGKIIENITKIQFNCNLGLEMTGDDQKLETDVCLLLQTGPFLVWRFYNDNSSFNCNLGFKMERGDGEQRDWCKIWASSNKPCSLFGIMMESRRRRPFVTNYVSFPVLHATFCEMYTRGRQLHWSHCPCLGSDTVKQKMG